VGSTEVERVKVRGACERKGGPRRAEVKLHIGFAAFQAGPEATPRFPASTLFAGSPLKRHRHEHVHPSQQVVLGDAIFQSELVEQTATITPLPPHHRSPPLTPIDQPPESRFAAALIFRQHRPIREVVRRYGRRVICNPRSAAHHWPGNRIQYSSDSGPRRRHGLRETASSASIPRRIGSSRSSRVNS